MFKIWAKVISKEKILKSFVYQNDGRFLIERFFDYMVEICQKLDIPTPVILSSHKEHFVNFNNTRFNKSDFIDTVSFTRLVLENVPE